MFHNNKGCYDIPNEDINDTRRTPYSMGQISKSRVTMHFRLILFINSQVIWMLLHKLGKFKGKLHCMSP